MNTKTKILIYGIDKPKVKVDRANGLEIIFCYGNIFNFIGVIATKGSVMVCPLAKI